MHQGLNVKYSLSGGTAVVSGPCTVTKENYSIEVDAVALRFWMTGNGYVQDLFPRLSAADREFLISGVSPEGWNTLFGEND